MKTLPAIAIVASAAALSACLPDITQATFETPAADGTFDVVLDESKTQVTKDESGNGYSYLVGVDTDEFVGQTYPVITVVAGVLPGSTVSDFSSSDSTATFTGTYEAVHIDVTQADESSTAEEVEALFYNSGDITLVANFGAGTLTGNAGDLTVNGTFSDKTLGGSVTHDGLKGDLEGIVGGDGAVGVFTGDNITEVLVGGFTVSD